MKHQSLGLSQATKRTRRREFFGETERVVLWTALVAPVVQYLPEGQRGRPPFPMGRMPRSHFMQHCFNLSDPAMEDALHDGPMSRGFAGLGGCHDRLFDDSTVLRFRRALEKRELGGESLRTGSAPLTAKGPMHKSGAVLDATLMAAPTSTNDDSGERHPEMEQSHKGHQWHFGMKAHMAVYVDNGPVFTVRGTAFSGNDVAEAYVLPYGQGSDTCAGARYLAAGKRPDAEPGGNRHIAIRPSKGQVLDRNDTIAAQTYDNEHLKARIRIKVEHPQGRTSVQSQQAPDRLHEGPLPRTGQERGAVAHAVCAGQPVYGQYAHPGSVRMSASDAGEGRHKHALRCQVPACVASGNLESKGQARRKACSAEHT